MVKKRILNYILFFSIFFVPFLALSFYANTPFHQLFFIVGIAICLWAGYFVGNLLTERTRLNREVFLQTYELRKAKEALESCMGVDSRTQIYYERLLGTRLSEECDRSRRYRRPLSFFVAGIDGYQELKQRFGSVVCEVLVQEVHQFIKESMRAVDIIIREGDDRVVTILPETSLDSARVAAERIRYAVEKKVFRIEDEDLNLTLSMGLLNFDASIHRKREDVQDSLSQLLTKARQNGANRVVTVNSGME